MSRNRKSNVAVTGSQTVALDDHDYEVGYCATASCIYAPAQLYGPPENCYPDESELNDMEILITDVHGDDGRQITETALMWARLAIELNDDLIKEQLWETFMTDERG